MQLLVQKKEPSLLDTIESVIFLSSHFNKQESVSAKNAIPFTLKNLVFFVSYKRLF